MTASAPAPDLVLSPPIHPAVSIQGVRKLFGTGDTAVRAVDGVDLDILDGEFFCLGWVGYDRQGIMLQISLKFN